LLTRIILEEVGPRDLVGIDPDPAEVGQARQLGIYSDVHVAGGERVPEPDGSFDWVLSNSVLEHIDHIEPVLSEVARVLRGGGQLLITVPGPDFHACMRGPLLPVISRSAYLDRLDQRLAHRRYWGPADWGSALAPHGMRVIDAVDYLNATEARRWEAISRFTAGVLYTLAARRRQPIEIQRQLGLRKPGRRMPHVLAASLAALLAAGLNGEKPGRRACFMIAAVKSTS
jgi:SAM-dependent methyltransferase